MVQARYSFGYLIFLDAFMLSEQTRSYFGVIAPVLLNLVNMIGFCILDCILGGQTLAAVADGNLSSRSVSSALFLLKKMPIYSFAA